MSARGAIQTHMFDKMYHLRPFGCNLSPSLDCCLVWRGVVVARTAFVLFSCALNWPPADCSTFTDISVFTLSAFLWLGTAWARKGPATMTVTKQSRVLFAWRNLMWRRGTFIPANVGIRSACLLYHSMRISLIFHNPSHQFSSFHLLHANVVIILACS